MIIEPVPLGPPSAPRRRLRAIALVVPLLLLAGVVAAGTLGPRPAPSPDPSVLAIASPATSSTPTAAAASPNATPPATTPDGRPAGTPARIAGLDVLTVAEALERRRAGLLEGVTAIAGYLGVRELPACGGTFCDRTGVLAQHPFGAATRFQDVGPHLHPQIPAGVVLPLTANLSDPDPAPDGPLAPAAVVIARFDDPRARGCLPGGRHCGEEVVVERVAWVAGESYPPMLAIGPGVPLVPSVTGLRSAGRAAERALGAGSTPLMTVLVRPDTIAAAEPAMAPLLTGLGAGPVWYVRGLQLTPGADAIAWVVAEPDGSLIMRGELPVIRPPAGT